MNKSKLRQKLVSFTTNSTELARINLDIYQGWSIVSLIKNGNYYIGIMELCNNSNKQTDSVYIPPRKKIKILRRN